MSKINHKEKQNKILKEILESKKLELEILWKSITDDDDHEQEKIDCLGLLIGCAEEARNHKEKMLKGCKKKCFDEENEFDYTCGTDELTRFKWEGVSVEGAEYEKNYCNECLEVINKYDKYEELNSK